MCSPCGPMVCYKYEDCGPPCLPRSAFKRNGLQDCQYFQQGSIRYLCRAGPCCSRPCPPRCPPCVRRPPPGKTYKGKSSDGANKAEESGSEKKDEKENQLKRTKSRELRGGIMYYSCHCIKRNGLQHDCRRTGCGGEPACLTLPDPLCAPSQLARARGLADPAPLAAHIRSQGGSGSIGSADSGSSTGKRFIVCELKGILPDISKDHTGKCKCPVLYASNVRGSGNLGDTGNIPPKTSTKTSEYPFISSSNKAIFLFDEKTIERIINSFETKELAKDVEIRGSHRNKDLKPVQKEEPCARPGCIHWQPPPPCIWDAPCKADCFEAPPGILPGRGGNSPANQVSTGAQAVVSHEEQRRKMKLLMPECCTGCSTADGGATSASSGPAAGLPVLVMKLC